MRKLENVEIAWMFGEIADLLELKGESVFKVRAYRKGAKIIANLPDPVSDLIAGRKFQDIPGIGQAIAAKTEELLTKGKIEYHENLKREIPQGLREMTAIPGIGPKMAQELYKKLGLKSVEDLEKAARDRKISSLPGMGSKTEMNILRGIEMLRHGVELTTLGIADAIASTFIEFLKSLPDVSEAEAGGSIRRGKDTIGDVDLVVGSRDPQKVIEVFVRHPHIRNILSKGDTKASVVTMMGVQVDMIVVEPGSFWSALHHFTGSKEHNVRLREIAHSMNLKINEYGVFNREDEQSLAVSQEEDVYAHLKLPYIPPELREDLGEIEAAKEGKLPELVKHTDIKGDLHLHSEWSDGVSTIQEIAGKALTLGYEYIAIADHSKSLGIARGLSDERLKEQEKEIKSLDDKTEELHILAGIEADILSNGEVDYSDEILAKRDVVVASIHSGFKQGREKLTDRIISAMKNKHVDVIAHPTGRLIARREPYDLDLEAIFDGAAKYGTALEINASPDRLDLKDSYVRKAKEMGIKICINTDAHDIMRIDDMKYGVATARRGWLSPGDVLNTMDYEQLMNYLSKR